MVAYLFNSSATNRYIQKDGGYFVIIQVIENKLKIRAYVSVRLDITPPVRC